MARLVYEPKNFRDATLGVINQANAILEEYERMGYDLTLRQLFYQFVSRGLIANKQSEYNKLGTIVNDGRLAGLIDWNHIVDRTRNVRMNSHWTSPASVIRAAASGYAIDKWLEQPEYVEVWIEKDALVGVIEGVCSRNDVPYFSCRGYTSQSEMWSAAQRLQVALAHEQSVKVIHLGDHDPSGIDMSRDIFDRLFLFLASDFHHDTRVDLGLDLTPSESAEYVNERFEVDRIALNMDQVEQYDPPPNPAKFTDSRAASYVAVHGYQSWELDALPPDVLDDLIEDAITRGRDDDTWNLAVASEDSDRRLLTSCSDRWNEVVEFLST